MAFYTEEDNKQRLSITELINQINAENTTDEEQADEITDFDRQREAYIQEEKEKIRIAREKEAYEQMAKERENTPEPEPEKVKKEPVFRKALGNAFAKVGEALYKKDETEYVEPEDDFAKLTANNTTKDLGEDFEAELEQQAEPATQSETIEPAPNPPETNNPQPEAVNDTESDGIQTADDFLKQETKTPEVLTNEKPKKRLFGRFFQKEKAKPQKADDIQVVKYVPPETQPKQTVSEAKPKPEKTPQPQMSQHERLRVKYEDCFSENHIFPDVNATRANIVRINDICCQFPASVVALVVVSQSMTQLVVYDKKSIPECIKIFEDANYDIDYEWIFLLTNISSQWYGSDDCPFDIQAIIENMRMEFMKAGQTPCVTESAIRKTKDIALFANIYIKTKQ